MRIGCSLRLYQPLVMIMKDGATAPSVRPRKKRATAIVVQLVVAPRHISAIPQRITVIPTNNVMGNLLIKYAAGYSDTN